jgi:hypothetical protein
MRVGFTGSGIYSMTAYQVERIIANLLEMHDRRGEIGRYDGPITEVHHGDCVKADEEFHDLVRKHLPDAKIVIHPPTDSKRRAFCKGDVILDPLPYLDRNHRIVDAVDEMLATPGQQTEILRSGTWATIRYAFRKKVFTTVIFPTKELIANEALLTPEQTTPAPPTEDKTKPEWITAKEWSDLTPKTRVHIRGLLAAFKVLGENYDRLRSAALMAREELVFGGDWETARKKIDEAVPKEKS